MRFVANVNVQARLTGFNPRRGRERPATFRKTPKENLMPKRPPTSRLPVRTMRDQSTTASRPSPLLLCDHLIALAQEADLAGYPNTAAHLVALVDGMFEETRLTR